MLSANISSSFLSQEIGKMSMSLVSPRRQAKVPLHTSRRFWVVFQSFIWSLICMYFIGLASPEICWTQSVAGLRGILRAGAWGLPHPPASISLQTSNSEAMATPAGREWKKGDKGIWALPPHSVARTGAALNALGPEKLPSNRGAGGEAPLRYSIQQRQGGTGFCRGSLPDPVFQCSLLSLPPYFPEFIWKSEHPSGKLTRILYFGGWTFFLLSFSLFILSTLTFRQISLFLDRKEEITRQNCEMTGPHFFPFGEFCLKSFLFSSSTSAPANLVQVLPAFKFDFLSFQFQNQMNKHIYSWSILLSSTFPLLI